jgi:opacity protein-like surface antigen
MKKFMVLLALSSVSMLSAAYYPNSYRGSSCPSGNCPYQSQSNYGQNYYQDNSQYNQGQQNYNRDGSQYYQGQQDYNNPSQYDYTNDGSNMRNQNMNMQYDPMQQPR